MVKCSLLKCPLPRERTRQTSKSCPLPHSQDLHETPLNRLLSEYIIRLIKTDVGCHLNPNTSRHVIPFPSRPGNAGLRDAASFGAGGAGAARPWQIRQPEGLDTAQKTPPTAARIPAWQLRGAGTQGASPCAPHPSDPTPTSYSGRVSNAGRQVPGSIAASGNPQPVTLPHF